MWNWILIKIGYKLQPLQPLPPLRDVKGRFSGGKMKMRRAKLLELGK